MITTLLLAVALPQVPDTGPVRIEAVKPPKAVTKLLTLLPCLAVDRASIRIRYRRLRISGGMEPGIPERAVAAIAGKSHNSSQDFAKAWWTWWINKAGELRATVSTDDETYSLSCQPGRIKKRYIDFMPNVKLTERPVFDLYTSQHMIRITNDDRTGIVCHISHRQDILHQTPNSILTPLPIHGRQIRDLRGWKWQFGESSEDCLREVRCSNPKDETNTFCFWMRPKRPMPSAVALRSGVARIAAVYRWKPFKGCVWAEVVGKVRAVPGDTMVELIEVESLVLRPKSRDVTLVTPTPVELLDHRFGVASYSKFVYDKLPSDVKAAYRCR